MKKLLCLVLCLALCLTMFVGCGEKAEKEGYELAFITDTGTIDDESFNQSSYEGMQAWAEANGKTYTDYEPLSSSTTDLVDTMTVAIANGAKVICCAGFVFPEAIAIVADSNPDVKFVLCDSDAEIPNCASFSYSVESAGFLAGYLSVMDGYTNLAYVGGISYPTVYNAGQGFMLGADAAARELGITIDQIYGHTGNFADTAENKALFASIYATGVEVLFSFGGGNQFSAFSAATEASPARWVVTPDVDGTGLSDRAYTSVMKALGYSVETALEDIYTNDFADYEGVNHVGIAEEMVGVPFDNSKFNDISDEVYAKAIKITNEQFAAGKIAPAEAGKTANDAATAGDVDAFVNALGITNSNITLWK